jgi:Mn-dependent DtxR family transcriptional regulator
MAKKLSVSRPSMSREMANMKDEGIIDYKMDMIRILDLDRIKDAIENGR